MVEDTTDLVQSEFDKKTELVTRGRVLIISQLAVSYTVETAPAVI